MPSHVGEPGWASIAESMRAAFAAGRFEAGAVAGIAAISRELLVFLPTENANLQHATTDTPRRAR